MLLEFTPKKECNYLLDFLPESAVLLVNQFTD